MALINRISPKHPERTRVHGPAQATFHIFEHEGRPYLQIDSYGPADRKTADKVSQSMQFGPEGMAELRRLLRDLE